MYGYSWRAAVRPVAHPFPPTTSNPLLNYNHWPNCSIGSMLQLLWQSTCPYSMSLTTLIHYVMWGKLYRPRVQYLCYTNLIHAQVLLGKMWLVSKLVERSLVNWWQNWSIPPQHTHRSHSEWSWYTIIHVHVHVHVPQLTEFLNHSWSPYKNKLLRI